MLFKGSLAVVEEAAAPLQVKGNTDGEWFLGVVACCSGGEIGGARGAGATPLSKLGGQCPPSFTGC